MKFGLCVLGELVRGRLYGCTVRTVSLGVYSFLLLVVMVLHLVCTFTNAFP